MSTDFNNPHPEYWQGRADALEEQSREPQAPAKSNALYHRAENARAHARQLAALAKSKTADLPPPETGRTY